MTNHMDNLKTINTKFTFTDKNGNSSSFEGLGEMPVDRDIFNRIEGFRSRFLNFFSDKVMNYSYETDYNNDIFSIEFMIEDAPEEPVDPEEPIEPPTDPEEPTTPSEPDPENPTE